jgi:hypothetical protein
MKETRLVNEQLYLTINLVSGKRCEVVEHLNFLG